MGSGLILLLIVGAWLAVLVPMALRSHDASALGTVDKFSDAMRVLSRREPVGRAEQPAARASSAPDAPSAGEQVLPGPRGRLRAGLRALLSRPLRLLRRQLLRRGGRVRRALTPAARRRRALLVLLAATAATLVGALVGPVWMLAPHLVVDVLLVVFLCWLRASAVRRAEREWRVAMGGRAGADADLGPLLPAEDDDEVAAAERVFALAGLARVDDVPDRLPTRDELDPRPEHRVPEPREAEAVSPSDAPADAGAQARGAQGLPWSPVPLPVPTYVTAPAAPPRRVLDLTGAGRPAWEEVPLDADESSAELEHVLGQRRAVGG